MSPDASRPRNLWLIASVALNLFLLGGIAGALLLGPPRHGFPGHGGGHEGLGEPGHRLSPAGQQALRALHEGDREALRPQVEALQAARQAMAQAFAAEPFDPAALAAAQARMLATEQALGAAMGARISRLAATLSAEDRQAFAQNMRRLPMGPPGGGPAGGEGGPRPPRGLKPS